MEDFSAVTDFPRDRITQKPRQNKKPTGWTGHPEGFH
jgi:hypothetical protein